jgi:hypothetical protein
MIDPAKSYTFQPIPPPFKADEAEPIICRVVSCATVLGMTDGVMLCIGGSTILRQKTWLTCANCGKQRIFNPAEVWAGRAKKGRLHHISHT